MFAAAACAQGRAVTCWNPLCARISSLQALANPLKWPLLLPF
jgi:hypothetical protein